MWRYAKVGYNSISYCVYRKSYPSKTLRSVDRNLYHNCKYWYDLTVFPSVMVHWLTFTYALYMPQIFQMDYWVKIRLFWENVMILIDLLIISRYLLSVYHSLNYICEDFGFVWYRTLCDEWSESIPLVFGHRVMSFILWLLKIITNYLLVEKLYQKWYNFYLFFTDTLCDWWSFDDCITWSWRCFYGWT